MFANNSLKEIMFDLNKTKGGYRLTVGEFKALLNSVPDDAQFHCSGSEKFYIHTSNDNKHVMIDIIDFEDDENKDEDENNVEEDKVELPAYISILNSLSHEIHYPHTYSIHYIFERYIALNNSKFIYLRSIFETNEKICDVGYDETQNTIRVIYKCGTIVKFRYTNKYDWNWEYEKTI